MWSPSPDGMSFCSCLFVSFSLSLSFRDRIGETPEASLLGTNSPQLGQKPEIREGMRQAGRLRRTVEQAKSLFLLVSPFLHAWEMYGRLLTHPDTGVGLRNRLKFQTIEREREEVSLHRHQSQSTFFASLFRASQGYAACRVKITQRDILFIYDLYNCYIPGLYTIAML